jgi:hypothetical protein
MNFVIGKAGKRLIEPEEEHLQGIGVRTLKRSVDHRSNFVFI